uniref:Urotensin-2 receptor n=1 Tax=Anas platyrhynchos TaxID=8839 RepID=A0A8B9ZDZ5_ANAPL
IALPPQSPRCLVTLPSSVKAAVGVTAVVSWERTAPVTGPLGTVLLLVCLVGMVGNIYTVLVASGRVSGRSAGSLGVYVINLALADLLYLSTIPFVLCTYFAHDWFFGDAGCRILLSLDLLTMHASIFLLTAMSLERYWAVTKPLRARRAGNAYRRLASAVLWLLALLLTAPMMAMTQLREGDGPHKRICVPTWTPAAFRLYLTVLFATSVLVPGMVLGIVYTRLARAYRSSRRLSSRISAIVVAYWACFLPFWGWQLAGLYQGEGLGIGPTAQAYLNFGVTCLAYGNSCINPFLYTLLASSYRRRPGLQRVRDDGVGGREQPTSVCLNYTTKDLSPPSPPRWQRTEP